MGDDIVLIHPWLHISSTLLDIKSWLRKEMQRKSEPKPAPPPLLLCGSLDRHRNQDFPVNCSRKLMQGTYCVLENVLPAQDIAIEGEQLCVLLGFWTTNRTVDGRREAKNWRDWSGASSLYKSLSRQEQVQVVRVEFLESHRPEKGAVFQYLVLVFLQATSKRAKLGVMDAVSRFRTQNMSGYVTVYTSKCGKTK